jgi:hypothetical protein
MAAASALSAPAVATPVQVSLDYGDGTTLSVAFAALPEPLRDELLRQPFAAPRGVAGTPSPVNAAGDAGRFLLLEWDDGWREVRRVSAACTGVGRYYVISRTEEMGRLALTTDTSYPELVEVARRPSRLRRITLDATLELGESRSAREGGKTDHFYATTAAGDAVAELAAALETAAADEGIDLASLARALTDASAGAPAASADNEAMGGQLERLRRRLGLCASFAQRDAVDFVAALVLTIDRDRTAAARPS